MKKNQNDTSDKKLSIILDRIETLNNRIEEIRLDTDATRSDILLLKLEMTKSLRDIGIIKIDVRKTKDNMEDIIKTTSEILAKMVTQKEFDGLSRRVAVLEN